MADPHNPSVLAALSEIGGGTSHELNGLIGNGPPPPPLPSPRGTNSFARQADQATQAAAQTSAAATKQTIDEAASTKGYSPLAAKKFARLAPLMPGADRVRIRQRRTDGSLSTIGDYSKTDVEHSGDIEAFVNTYIRPSYGGGEYQIALVDSAGREFDGGLVRFVEPAKDPHRAAVPSDPAQGFMPLVVEMFRKSTETKPVVDPVQQLRATKDLLMEMSPKSNGSNDVLAMMMQMHSQSQQMQQAAQQQAQQAQAAQQQQMMALMTQKPAVDPSVAALLDRMDRRLEKLETVPVLPPMPPMMPAAPGYTMPELISAIATAVGAIVPLVRGESVKPTELASLMLQAQTAAAPKDQLGVRDVIEIFKQREADASPPATLEEQMGTLLRLKEFTNAFSPPQQQERSGAGFWDAAVAIFGPHSEISKVIGRRIDNGTEQQKQIQVTHYPTQQSPSPAPAGTLPAQAPPQEEAGVPVPPGFDAKLAALSAAETPGARVTATIDALLALWPLQEWRQGIQTLLGAVAQNPADPTPALKALGAWLSMFIKANAISRETSMQTLHAFKTNYVEIRTSLLEQVPMLRQMAPPVDVAPAPPAAEGATAEAAEAANEESEEPSGEKQTGPAPVVPDLGHDSDIAAYSSNGI